MNSLQILLQRFPDRPWNWWFLSANPNITWEFIQANPDKHWSSYGISLNPNITWEIIKNNPQIRWKWEFISENNNIKIYNQVIIKNLNNRATKLRKKLTNKFLNEMKKLGWSFLILSILLLEIAIKQ